MRKLRNRIKGLAEYELTFEVFLAKFFFLPARIPQQGYNCRTGSLLETHTAFYKVTKIVRAL